MDRKKIFVVPETFRDNFFIRFVICNITNEEDIVFAWNEIRSATLELMTLQIKNNKLHNGYVKSLQVNNSLVRNVSLNK